MSSTPLDTDLGVELYFDLDFHRDDVLYPDDHVSGDWKLWTLGVACCGWDVGLYLDDYLDDYVPAARW